MNDPVFAAQTLHILLASYLLSYSSQRPLFNKFSLHYKTAYYGAFRPDSYVMAESFYHQCEGDLLLESLRIHQYRKL